MLPGPWYWISCWSHYFLPDPLTADDSLLGCSLISAPSAAPAAGSVSSSFSSAPTSAASVLDDFSLLSGDSTQPKGGWFQGLICHSCAEIVRFCFLYGSNGNCSSPPRLLPSDLGPRTPASEHRGRHRGRVWSDPCHGQKEFTRWVHRLFTRMCSRVQSVLILLTHSSTVYSHAYTKNTEMFEWGSEAFTLF